jgi:nicotinamide riboside kinase
MMKNIYIIGAASTGKTTLVNALKTSFEHDASRHHNTCPTQPCIIPELARTVLREKGFNRQDITTSPIRALRIQQYILNAQYTAETTSCPPNTAAWCICDRSGIDPIVYAKCFAGVEASEGLLASTAWLELEARMKRGIVVLCEVGNNWLVDDGVRLMPNDASEWTYMDRSYRGLLEWRGIEFSVLPKHLVDLKKRVEFVRRLVDAQSMHASG